MMRLTIPITACLAHTTNMISSYELVSSAAAPGSSADIRVRRRLSARRAVAVTPRYLRFHYLRFHFSIEPPERTIADFVHCYGI